MTFNGKRFDFPYLIIRSAIMQVSPSLTLPIEPGSTHPHFDVYEVLAGNPRHRKGNLDYFTDVFGFPSPKQELDGSQVSDAFREGRIEDIARYCLADCHATADLYGRLKAFF